jgi:hypothetical protein
MLEHIRLIETEGHLFVEAAQNVEINASCGRYVAFLAGDCIALPGWAEGRCERHESGALMVSTVVASAHPDTFVGALVDHHVFAPLAGNALVRRLWLGFQNIATVRTGSQSSGSCRESPVPGTQSSQKPSAVCDGRS